MLDKINTLMILVSQIFLVRYIYAINKGIEQLTKENLILIEKTRVMQEANEKIINEFMYSNSSLSKYSVEKSLEQIYPKWQQNAVNQFLEELVKEK